MGILYGLTHIHYPTVDVCIQVFKLFPSYGDAKPV